MNKNRILHIISGTGMGGAERTLFNLLNSNLADKHEMFVISLTPEEEFGRRINNLKIQIHFLNLKRGRIDVFSIYNLIKIVKKIKPNIIQGWMHFGNLVALLVYLTLFDRSIKLIWNIRQSFYGIEIEKKLNKMVIYLCAFFSKIPNKIIYNSSLSSIQHTDFGFSDKNKIIILNGFDTNYWKPNPYKKDLLKKSMNFSEDNFIVGYVGRDDKFKDINTLINAIEIVSLLNLNIKFVLMGNKLDNENIKFIKILHKWSSSIRLLGGGFDSYEIMPVFDLLVLSSKSEAFPNVVGEGMSMSIPCISTSVGEISQLINDCGWLIPVGDSNILSDKIVEAYNLFLNNKKYWNELRFKSRNRIIKYFNIDLMLYRYNNLWENF